MELLQNKSFQKGSYSSSKTAEPDFPKEQGNKNNIKIINNKNNNNILYSSIIEYLNAKAGTSYRASTKASQQHINARLSEGFTEEDFKSVIDKKVAEWKGTEWEQYLRPTTLFGTKFESYLNAKARKTVGVNGIAVTSEASELDDVF